MCVLWEGGRGTQAINKALRGLPVVNQAPPLEETRQLGQTQSEAGPNDVLVTSAAFARARVCVSCSAHTHMQPGEKNQR